MKTRLPQYCLLFVTLLVAAPASAHVSMQQPRLAPPAQHDRHEIVRMFLQAVNRGEVMLFGHDIKPEMLQPTRVEYIYELNSPTPEIRVYSEITTPLAVPDNDTCEIRALSATLDEQGNIIEVKAHVWPK